ncbi:MAG: UGSC family (seleno)protein, partial [Sphingomicrobium sp.]
YMPVLVALVEAMADPTYGVEHSGNTPGGETLIILNGPIIDQLGVNATQGVMRDGFRPNTSIGRFWRLYLRNVAGFLLHKTDKATFGNTWRVLIAENERAVAGMDWQPNSVDMGFEAGDNVVTIARYTGGNMVSSMAGSTPEELLPFLADAVVRQNSWQITFTMGQGYGKLRPLVLLSPIIAETIASAGWSKQDVQRYLFEHARMPAWEFERFQRDWQRKPIWSLRQQADLGNIPREVFLASDDPNRMVPIVWAPEHFMIVVTGDPLRTSSYVFGHNGQLGFPVAKRIALPGRWDTLLAERGGAI